MKLPSADVVVIGGGAIGTAVAFSLAKAGTRVTLVERAGLAREASGANVGLVTLFSAYSFDEPDPGPLYALTRASMEVYAGLGEEAGIDVEYERCGGVVVGDSEEKLAPIRRAYEGYRKHGVPVEWLDPDGVRACEPAFHSDKILGGVFCPLNGQVNPLLATRALARRATQLGAAVLLGTSVRGIVCRGGRVEGVQTSAGDIACEFVVNAAGAWAADIGAMVGVPVPVVPARGQILLTEPVPRFIHRVVAGSEPSARQTRRGNVIVGSTVENAGFDKGVTTDTIHHFARDVLPYFPRLRGLSVIRTWAGLRPASPDHKPIIQLLEEPRGFCLAAGHSRRGICYAPGTGQLVAELITGKPPSLPAQAFRLDRFASAAPGRGGAR
jgi:glycine/D-amino acid oxidase-like deaminating enzyme